MAADLSSYEAFLKNKLTRLDGIASIESSFALSQVKYSIALPVWRGPELLVCFTVAAVPPGALTTLW